MDKEKFFRKMLKLAEKLGEHEVKIRVYEHSITGIVETHYAINIKDILGFSDEKLAIIGQENGMCQLTIREEF